MLSLLPPAHILLFLFPHLVYWVVVYVLLRKEKKYLIIK